MLTERFLAIAQVGDQFILWLLVGLSIISIAFIFERFFVLRSINYSSKIIRQKVKVALASQNYDIIEELGKDVGTLEGRAISLGLKHVKESGSKGLEELFNSLLLIEKPDLERFLNFMATLGSNAPYIGLLGTVMGIMKAFHDLSVSTEAGQQTVMAGISSALVATAAGLFVAIPAVLAYNYFSKQVKGILQNLDIVKELCISIAKKKGL
jgi:biopolymer transport protein ExbB